MGLRPGNVVEGTGNHDGVAPSDQGPFSNPSSHTGSLGMNLMAQRRGPGKASVTGPAILAVY